MTTSSYLGGILTTGTADPSRGWPATPGETPDPRELAGPPPGTVEEDWGWVAHDAELFVHAPGTCCRLFTWDALALLVRGHVRPAGLSGPLDVERVAEELRCHYLERGRLAVEGLEGGFTLALLDGAARRVLLYRNLAGTGHTYYHASPRGLLFGSNLADLVDASGLTPRPNRAALPAFFLFRAVPGPETLFEDFHRLLPGEELCWDARGLSRRQRQTFADLAGPVLPAAEALDRLEATLHEVLADCAALRPGTANLLSGGVDSSYLQALWNKVVPGDDLPTSYSVSVEHPHTWTDTDYALTAARALGTRHRLIPADDPYAGYLVETLASTGEPPNHVQSAYFGHLARELAARGVTAGLCGEGADSLFGLGLANQVHNARFLARRVPTRLLRRVGGVLSQAIGWDRLAHTFWFADHLGDFADLRHPVNKVAVFADLPAVSACFGEGAVAGALAARRGLLDRLGVPADPMERLHAVGFLGEAVDSAALWATLFNGAGLDLLCPFLDSRMLRLAARLPGEVRYRFRRPKDLLKRALARHIPAKLVYRPKLGFGQPIFEWLAPGGQLRPLVETLGGHDFLDPRTLARVRREPTWFLYSLLCYDTWHRLFIERSLPRPGRAPAGRRVEMVPW
jgi:asparagine synthase (glutamine-hydrolysing)